MICDKVRACIDNEKQSGKLFRCCNDPKVCIESSDTRSSVKCEENKKVYMLENTMKNHVISYKMDGGIILADRTVPAGTVKCDYLIVIDAPDEEAVLVELKGIDVRKAFDQISATLDLYKDLFVTFGHVYARVVATSAIPNLKASPEYVKLATKVKRYHGNVKIKERKFSEKDGSLKVL